MALGNTWTNVAQSSWSDGVATVTFYIDVKLNRQDTTNNYSVVDTKLRSTVVNNAAGSGFAYTLTGSAGWSGNSVWYFANEDILTGQTTIYHDPDGKKVGSASSYCYNKILGINITFSGSFELPTIPRASTVTVNPNPFNIGDTITINTNRASTSFTHTLSLSFGNFTYSIGSGITDSTTLDTSTIATDLYQNCATDAAKTGSIICTTYSGTTTIGTTTTTFTAKVVNSNPTFDVAYEDTNATTLAITSDDQQIIQNNSTLVITATNMSAKNYASLDSIVAIINGTTYNGTIAGTTGTISVGTLNLSSNTVAQVVVTDTRGISTTTNVSLEILGWQLPTAIITLNRQSNFYSETDINVDADYSSLDSKNTISIKVRSKKTTDQNYGAYTTLTDGVTSVLTLDNLYAWNVQVLLEDSIGSTTYNLTVGIGIPIVFFDRMKRSMGVDCFPKNSESLEVLGGDILNIFGIRTDTWDSNTTYRVGDVVCYNRTLYQNKTGTNSTEPDTDTTNWEQTSILV